MNTFHLQIVTPDGCAFDGEAEELLVKTSEGYVGILAKHLDYAATLVVGEAVVISGGKPRRAACGGGFLSVASGEVTMVVTTFEYAENIDLARAAAAQAKAEARMQAARDAEEYAAATAKLMRALTRQQVAGGMR